ncbi:Hsp70 family protein [Micromonospora echinofusca]|uniref:Hsp70 family protein n=1 Tax=Micromonospora echinofusca TaxID=47858 RepID=A0ABS3VR12_MICEH|nr:Hsp70 family protein [Micromonospora echinofusca]MBO4206980.1 Hsp70 family protein [Micromonospora echinofusca]
MTGQYAGHALGVDLGTSNTVAVLRAPDGRTRPLLVDGQPIMPSGVYADASGRLHVGRDAQRLAQADPSRFEPHPKRQVDAGTVLLGDREYTPAELFAAILGAVAHAAVEAVGFLPPAVLTYPASWGTRRRQVLVDALTGAGWPPPAAPGDPVGTRLVPEPAAAARYFTDVLHRPVPVGSALAVFDFGGGTLDVAVVRNGGTDPDGRPRFEVACSGGLADLGGLDLDAALVDQLGTVLASTEPDAWQRLGTPESAAQLRDRRQFWAGVRDAKEMLSRSAAAPVVVPGVDHAAHLTRDELEQVAAPLVRRAVAETGAVIAASGVPREGLAGLFLVGGSSRVPLVARLLHAELGIAPTVLEQPELPVAEGALAMLPSSTPPARTPAAAVPPVPPPGAVAAPPVPPPGAAAVPSVPSPGAAPPPGFTVSVPPPGVAVPAPPPHPVGRRWGRRRVRVVVAAVLALAGVVTAAVLYLTRDGYSDLDFTSASEIGRVPIAGDSPSAVFTALLDDRAYVAYQRPEDNRLDVRAIRADDPGDERWHRQTTTAAERWARIVALPGALAAVPDLYSNDQGDLVVLDGADGTQRWTRRIGGDDGLLFFDEVAVLVDRVGERLVGLRLRDGRELWTLPNPRGDYGTETVVYPVTGPDELGGPADLGGGVLTPLRGDDRRLVQVGADRSVRVVDPVSGRVVKSRPNVADRDDLVVAHDGTLFVATDEGGYRLVAYDLGSLGEPVNLYTAQNGRTRPKSLSACGGKRVCLLEVTDFDAASTQVVVTGVGQETRRWDAPGSTVLVPVGDHVLTRNPAPEPRSTLFGVDGAKLRERDGVAVRLDGGNLLVFADEPASYPADQSVAGLPVGSARPVELGQLREVRATSCSWNPRVIVCPSRSDFVFYRFTEE